MIVQKDVFSDAWCDFIFESRNKAYGAYALRKRYPDNVGIAFFITVAVFGLGLSAPTIYKHLFPETETIIDVPTDGPTWVEPLFEEPIVPPSQPLENHIPLNNTIEAFPPKIVEESQVDNSNVPTQEMFAEANPGITTETGTGVGPGTETGTGTQVFVVSKPASVEPAFFTIVEQMPEFIGGESAMLKFIHSKIKYPQVPKELGIAGTAYISFIVNKEGKVLDAKVVKGFDRQCEQEALRVINSMPVWKPGKQNGEAVNVQFTLPIRFILQ